MSWHRCMIYKCLDAGSAPFSAADTSRPADAALPPFFPPGSMSADALRGLPTSASMSLAAPSVSAANASGACSSGHPADFFLTRNEATMRTGRPRGQECFPMFLRCSIVIEIACALPCRSLYFVVCTGQWLAKLGRLHHILVPQLTYAGRDCLQPFTLTVTLQVSCKRSSCWPGPLP